MTRKVRLYTFRDNAYHVEKPQAAESESEDESEDEVSSDDSD